MSAGSHGDPTDLELRWNGLAVPSGDRLTADRLRDWAGGPVLAALDSSGIRHLLVRIDDNSGPPRLPRPVAGVRLSIRQLQPLDQPDADWFDLASSDPAWNAAFTGLCADIVRELPAAGSADPATLLAVLERWRRFWAAAQDGLTRDEQTGLVGELWLLLEWLPRLTAVAVTAWQGPLKGRHDFVTDTVSVEVKTTRAATGPVVHRVTRLDQLDEPGSGQLYLLSIRAVPDPLGNASLDTLLTRVWRRAARTGPTCAALLDERLDAVGVTPADRGRYTEPLRVAQQELFAVDDDFPRLIPSSFPAGPPGGVVDIAYSLDTSACQPWLLTTASNSGQNALARLFL